MTQKKEFKTLVDRMTPEQVSAVLEYASLLTKGDVVHVETNQSHLQ